MGALEFEYRPTILPEFENQFFGDGQSHFRQLTFLLPTGLMHTLRCDTNSTFAQIKTQLWRAASHNPGYDSLQVPTRYAFNCYQGNLQKEEIVDENMRLSEIKIFRNIVLVVEKVGDKQEKKFNIKLGSIISLPMFKIHAMNGREEKDFRRHIHSLCEGIVKERQNEDFYQRMREVYPPILSADVCVSVRSLGNARVNVNLLRPNSAPVDHTLPVPLDSYPMLVIQKALTIFYQLKEVKDSECDAGSYLLKVVGAEEYIYGEVQLARFKYVQKCLQDNKLVNLTLVKMATLTGALEYRPFQRCSMLRMNADRDSDVVTGRSLWDVEGMFSLTIGKATNVLGEEGANLFVRLCIYHGGEQIVSEVKTQTTSLSRLEWNEKVTFNIRTADLPRSARLCCILALKRRRPQSLAWANIPLFDYQGVLKSGDEKLKMWDCNNPDESFHYIGTTTSNTRDECVTLSLTFQPNISNVRYPDISSICELSARLIKQATENSEMAIRQYGHEKLKSDDKIVYNLSNKTEPPASYIDDLTKIVHKDPLEDIFEQEKTLLWQMRIYCKYHLPNSLPKLLRSFDWSDHEKVALMLEMVKSWQPLDPEYALELLDYQYPDVVVRDFAVECLVGLTDSQLSCYLLQLVQVLKYESYLDNKLTRFLLKRAIKCSRIGHNFFWHLRSEMHQKELITRFGLILEAYCRANVQRTDDIMAQHRSLEMLNHAAKKAKDETKFGNEDTNSNSKTMAEVKKILGQEISPFMSVSSFGIKVQNVVTDKCKVMDSKKKPIFVVFENADPLGSRLTEMFKVGDDLRQDCLTLQMLGLMDELWQQHNLDLKLNVYGCISTGDMMGLIAPVPNSETLADIHAGGSGAFNHEVVMKWLHQHNPGDRELTKAIDNFTKSCAGYCVATYVLGIGDRHSDNIMLTKTGKLFHIDFGHFLGNVKYFAGFFKRERVPMIMMSAFVCVITHGKHKRWSDSVKDDTRFKDFMNMCVDAFLVIRDKSTLFINLFALMCSSGIPELSSLNDLQFLKTTLFLEQSQQEAISLFKKKMYEALKGEFTTKVNFWFHNKAHNK